MSLITSLAEERNLSALINIHDVILAQEYVNRIIGMREGKIVFDDSPDKLNKNTLTIIYGEENWDTIENNYTQEKTKVEGGNANAGISREKLRMAASSSNKK
jgi:phosphonate transport system ATP-binding protein